MADLDVEQELAGKKLDRGMLKRVFALLRPVRGWVLLMIVVEVALVSTIFIRPWFFQVVIDDGLVPLAEGGFELNVSLVWLLALGLTMTWFLRFIMFGFGRYVIGIVSLSVLGDLQRQIFQHVQALDVAYFDRTKAGRIVSRADSDVGSLYPLVIEGPPQILSLLLRCLGASMLLTLLWPDLMLYLLMTAPPLILAMVVFKNIGTRVFGKVSEATSRVTAHIVETVGGVRAIQQSVAEERNAERYDEHLGHLKKKVMSAAWLWGWFPATDYRGVYQWAWRGVVAWIRRYKRSR